MAVSLSTPFVLATVAKFLSAVEYKRTVKQLNKAINRFDESRYVIHHPKHGPVSEDDRVTHYREGIRHGPYRKYHANRALAEEKNFDSGKLHGKSRTWRPDGQPIETADYNAGKIGRRREWSADGEPLSDVEYHAGVLHGKCKYWISGQLTFDSTYANGEPHGESRTWHTNGQRHAYSTYKNGKLHGRHRTWDTVGNKHHDRKYSAGQLRGACHIL